MCCSWGTPAVETFPGIFLPRRESELCVVSQFTTSPQKHFALIRMRKGKKVSKIRSLPFLVIVDEPKSSAGQVNIHRAGIGIVDDSG